MINKMEKAGAKILRFLAAVAFVDAVYLFNEGDFKSAVFFAVAAVLLRIVSKEGYLI